MMRDFDFFSFYLDAFYWKHRMQFFVFTKKNYNNNNNNSDSDSYSDSEDTQIK